VKVLDGAAGRAYEVMVWVQVSVKPHTVVGHRDLPDDAMLFKRLQVAVNGVQ